MTRTHKAAQNQFHIDNQQVKMTIQNKKGKALMALFDLEDLSKVQEAGTWFAEWHKDFNQYLAQNVFATSQKGKSKFQKRNLQSLILGTSPNAPIRHLNGNTLDNRKENLEIYNRFQRNEFEQLENNVVALILKNRYGTPEAKALISAEDLDKVVTDQYTWICQKRSNGQPYVIAHTEEGRVYLSSLLKPCEPGYRVRHINKNPLDNRRQNLEIYQLELES